ncbi:MAG: hypothetical protein ABSG54_00050 [Terriglobia bacterium]|jgi:hypothetical protein
MPLGRSRQMEQSGENEALNRGLPRIVTTFYVMEIYMKVPPFLVLSESASSGFLGLAWDGASLVPGGEFHESNFDTYPIPHFSWLPEIETVILDAKDSPPQGGGEPAVICMGALIANAVFDATGARLLQLPMTPERIKAALSRG